MRRMGRFSRLTRPFNVLGLPALSVPCGFSGDGRPLALQIAGRPFDEATVLRVGHAYERATDWHTRHPVLGSPLPARPPTTGGRRRQSGRSGGRRSCQGVACS